MGVCQYYKWSGTVENSSYYLKVDTQPENRDIKFHNPVQSEMKKAIYVRTAYIKKAADKIRRKIIDWGVHGVGETRGGFLRDTVAPRIKPGMPTYDELKQIIFGS